MHGFAVAFRIEQCLPVLRSKTVESKMPVVGGITLHENGLPSAGQSPFGIAKDGKRLQGLQLRWEPQFSSSRLCVLCSLAGQVIFLLVNRCRSNSDHWTHKCKCSLFNLEGEVEAGWTN